MTILNIGKEAFNSTEVAEKVQHDIDFLLARIEHLQQQVNPNPVVLQTYQEMLESRQELDERLQKLLEEFLDEVLRPPRWGGWAAARRCWR